MAPPPARRIPVHDHSAFNQGGVLSGVVGGGGDASSTVSPHPGLAEHDGIGLATDAELAAHVAADVKTINVIIDGGGVAITTGIKGDLKIDFACIINEWSLLANEAGAIVIDIWRDTYANFPPTDADAMPGAGKEPTIAATNASAQDTTLTDWTSDDIAAGDILRFNVDSCVTITRVTLALKVTRVP